MVARLPAIQARPFDITASSPDTIDMEELPTERLIYLLRHGDGETQVEAARCLAGRGAEPPAHAALYEATFAADVRIRAAAAAALIACPDDRTLIRLADLLGDRRLEVRRAAAEALRDLGDPAATLPLLDALQDNNRWLVLAAVEGLERFGTTAARPTLRKLTASRDWGISQAAKRALAAVEARQP